MRKVCIKAGARCATLLANEQKGHSAHDADEGSKVAPVQRLTQEGDHEDAENDQRQRFLNDLQLAGTPAAGKTDAIGRNRKAVLNKGNCPADENDRDSGLCMPPLRCQYQATVMKMLEAARRRIVCMASMGLH